MKSQISTIVIRFLLLFAKKKNTLMACNYAYDDEDDDGVEQCWLWCQIKNWNRIGKVYDSSLGA